MLQVADFRRMDTVLFDLDAKIRGRQKSLCIRVPCGQYARFVSARDQRVYFTASADPLGSNPSHDCQMFSMEPLSGDLRQVTYFHEGGDDHWAACLGGRRPQGCRVDFTEPAPQNPATGTIYFRSTCDPLGLNPNGAQLFAIQPDGTGLQQISDAGGFVRGADRTMETETVEYLCAYAPPR